MTAAPASEQAAASTAVTLQISIFETLTDTVSYQQLLQEVAALRQRLHDSSFEVVAGEQPSQRFCNFQCHSGSKQQVQYSAVYYFRALLV